MNYYKNYKSALKINLDNVESFFSMKAFIKSKMNNKDINILDIGCGIGYLTNYFSDIGSVTGIDLNEEAISIAKKNFPEVTFLNLNILENKNGLKDKFDFIICNNVVEHLEDKHRDNFLTIMNNNLIKNNGYIIFGYANPYHPMQLIWGLLTQKVLFDKTHVHNWTINQFKKVIEPKFKIIDTKKTSPFTKFIGIGKYFKGDILIFSQKKV